MRKRKAKAMSPQVKARVLEIELEAAREDVRQIAIIAGLAAFSMAIWAAIAVDLLNNGY